VILGKESHTGASRLGTKSEVLSNFSRAVGIGTLGLGVILAVNILVQMQLLTYQCYHNSLPSYVSKPDRGCQYIPTIVLDSLGEAPTLVAGVYLMLFGLAILATRWLLIQLYQRKERR